MNTLYYSPSSDQVEVKSPFVVTKTVGNRHR